VESLEVEVSSFGKDASALGAAALVYDQILSVPDSNFLEDLDLNEAAIEQEISRLEVRPLRSSKGSIREDSERLSSHGNAWTEPDVISFVIRWASVWNTPGIAGLDARLPGLRREQVCVSSGVCF